MGFLEAFSVGQAARWEDLAALKSFPLVEEWLMKVRPREAQKVREVGINSRALGLTKVPFGEYVVFLSRVVKQIQA